MVKRVSRPFYANPKKKYRRRWWRGLIGVLLTALIVVPYMMGSDLEKYLRHWIDVSNQEHSTFHLELQNYQRHWLSSEADLIVSGQALHQPLPIHFKAYHGPLCLKAGSLFRFGLGFVEGHFEAKDLLGQQELVQIEGPVELTAFIPYFNDRELHAGFPPFMISDKANHLVYHFLNLQGNIDSDGLLHLDLPSLEVNTLEGNKAALISTAVLRIQPRSEQASLSLKQLDIYGVAKEQTTISNLVLQTNTQNLAADTGAASLALNLHFDQLKGLFAADELMDLGPFECQLKMTGLEAKGFNTVLQGLKLLGAQGGDLTVQQGEQFEKAWGSIISAATVFDLSSKLNTVNGAMEAEFHGGFKPETVDSLLTDSFYTKGAIRLSGELREALSKYVESISKEKDGEEALAPPLTLMLDLMKQDGQSYVTTVDVKAGKVLFNGKGSPS